MRHGLSCLFGAPCAPTGMIVSRCEHDARILPDTNPARLAAPTGVRSGRAPGSSGRLTRSKCWRALPRYRVVRRSAPGRFGAPRAAPGPARSLARRNGCAAQWLQHATEHLFDEHLFDERVYENRRLEESGGVPTPPTPLPRTAQSARPTWGVVGLSWCVGGSVGACCGTVVSGCERTRVECRGVGWLYRGFCVFRWFRGQPQAGDGTW